MDNQKRTKWEKELEEFGYSIIDFTHEEIASHLLEIFRRDIDDLLLIAASDNSNRKNLTLVLDHGNLGNKLTTFGGTINYNRKRGKFNYITYSDRRNYAVSFSIESGAASFSYDHYQRFKSVFPFGVSIKRMTEYLLTH